MSETASGEMPLMTWSNVQSVLKEEITKFMNNPSDGEKWVEALGSNSDGRRLGICIAIDVLSKAVEPESFVKILNEADYSDESLKDACGVFGNALANLTSKQKFFCVSSFGEETLHDDDTYLRVLRIVDFIEYYAQINWEGITLDEVGKNKFLNMFFVPWAEIPLGTIRNTWSGGTGRVWVTSFREYEGLVKGKQDAGSFLNDSLGLGFPVVDNEKPLLLGVKYPKDFKTVACYQPTTLDAGFVWSGNYYISYRNRDSWGRTQSCSGSQVSLRERIHQGFEGLTDEFSLIKIGEVNDLQSDRDRLLVEAFKRFLYILDIQHLESLGRDQKSA